MSFIKPLGHGILKHSPSMAVLTCTTHQLDHVISFINTWLLNDSLVEINLDLPHPSPYNSYSLLFLQAMKVYIGVFELYLAILDGENLHLGKMLLLFVGGPELICKFLVLLDILEVASFLGLLD
jgi:hypothetical protein